MQPIPLTQQIDVAENKTPFRRGLLIGFVIVLLFWLGVLILGGAMLILH
jgi:hypothetical protein